MADKYKDVGVKRCFAGQDVADTDASIRSVTF